MPRLPYRVPMSSRADVITRTGDWGSIAVSPFGATVVSWCPDGVERLFTASDASPVLGEMWHGGIPVCAPWFGRGRGDWSVPHPHGLVSRVSWRLVGEESRVDGCMLEWRTDAAATSHLPGAQHYPPDLGYSLRIEASATALVLSLRIDSPTTEVVVDEAFHPYLRTGLPATVSGLNGVAFRDFAADHAGSEDSALTVDRYVDRVYCGAPETTLTDDGARLGLAGDAASSLIIWNPGPGSGMVPGDEWRDFVCIEYGNVQGNAVTIPAGGEHTLRTLLQVS
ncbi:D-hexose-6-phosphate mutarotase [Tessaracoccus defluvii]